MTYPKIYSLSTVGLIKHYNHDYLFHPVRTDFIGANGVGKSIIADLLQMLFIYDTETIKFGTDGLQKDKRSIYTLPYKSKVGYCFLNIEVEKDQFICIGICISKQRGQRIVPFVITRSADISIAKDRLTLNPEQLLFAKGVLENKTIPDLQGLGKKLLQQHDLYLVNFKRREDVSSIYYRFLYEKNILPINLSQEKDFVAFSKVIQSFSKAKTLELGAGKASRSLKDFLFEDSDTDLMDNYKSHQSALEKILSAYNELNSYTSILLQKQKMLISLREQEKRYLDAEQKFSEAELSAAYFQKQDIKEWKLKGEQALDQERIKLEKLERLNDKIPRIDVLIEAAIKRANDSYDLHILFEKLMDGLGEHDLEKEMLEEIRIPVIDPSWEANVPRVDMSTKSATQIKADADYADLYLAKYPAFYQISTARDIQNNLIDEKKVTLTNSKNDKTEMLLILLDQTENSLIHWFIQHKTFLTTDQRHALLQFAATSTIKQSSPIAGSRYIDPLVLFADFEIEVDTAGKGYWLSLGAVKEFVAFDPRTSLFEDNQDIKKSMNELCGKLREDIQTADKALQELQKFNDMKAYDASVVGMELDQMLVEQSSIEKLKNSVASLLQLQEKKDAMRTKRHKLTDELERIKKKFPAGIISSDPESLKHELAKMREQQHARSKRFATYAASTNVSVQASEKLVKEYEHSIKTFTENLVKSEENFNSLNLRYIERFDQELQHFNKQEKALGSFEESYIDIYDAYKNKFSEITFEFDETSNHKNPAVNLEITGKTYSFRVLEQALLGTMIKSTDDIAAALDDANQNRITMADNIRDNMIKVFENTAHRYKKYKEQIQTINMFFKGRMISGRFYFKLDFQESKRLQIGFVEEMAGKIRTSARTGELQFGQSVDVFIEEFFSKLARLHEKVPIEKLLNAKSYFELSVALTDQNGVEIPGSTGETYSAIALLGIARLSVVKKEQRPGLRFIILEEIGSLDDTNFNTFPAIAQEFDYQIITMAPHIFNIGLSDEWYAHHLIKGKNDQNINFHPSSSYFKTESHSIDLKSYLNKAEA